uniref:SCP domain-containing protein n=1 Tax=Suricata suricatta TaxID=37032 RepID=A0A673U410_SURSU
MWVALAVTAWTVSLVLSYGNTAVSLPDIENEDFIKDCVRSHNKFRSEVNPRASDMLYMTWDPVLARVAKTWARNCQFAHNTQLHSSFKLHPNFSSLGENIWAGSLPQFSASSAITAWHNEIEYYEFRTQKCTWVCGHYTQVVWAASYKVGCAVQFCPSIHGTNIHDGAFFICNYGPGQYRGQPYTEGSSCSACPKDDQCLDNLCSDKEYPSVALIMTTNKLSTQDLLNFWKTKKTCEVSTVSCRVVIFTPLPQHFFSQLSEPVISLPVPPPFISFTAVLLGELRRMQPLRNEPLLRVSAY